MPVVLGTTGRGRRILNHDLSQAKGLVDLGSELARKHGKPLVVGTGAETMERAMDLTAYAGSRDVFAVRDRWGNPLLSGSSARAKASGSGK